MSVPYQNDRNGTGKLRSIREENRLAISQRDSGLDCGEKAVAKGLLLIDIESVILSKLDEVHDVGDIELLFDGGKLPVDRPFAH